MKKCCEIAFRQGYFLAVANLARDYHEETLAEYLLGDFGDLETRGVDEYDLKVIRPLISEIKRKERLTRRRTP